MRIARKMTPARRKARAVLRTLTHGPLELLGLVLLLVVYLILAQFQVEPLPGKLWDLIPLQAFQFVAITVTPALVVVTIIGTVYWLAEWL